MNYQNSNHDSIFISPDNPAQCRWAHRYLLRQLGVRGMDEGSDYERSTTLLNSLDGANRELILRKMNDAWRVESYRKNQEMNGYKQCSFILSEESLMKLNTLAKDMDRSLKETLEQLINRASKANEKKKEKNKKAKELQFPLGNMFI